MFTEKQIARFWKNVDIKTLNQCWNWRLGVDHDGYGKVRIGGRALIAHRVAFALGQETELPGRDTEIRHTCDNRRCCNPKHLVAGSHTDNMQDMLLRGRRSVAANWHLKLEKTRADQLRFDFQNGLSKRALSRKYNIVTKHVRDILKGISWK